MAARPTKATGIQRPRRADGTAGPAQPRVKPAAQSAEPAAQPRVKPAAQAAEPAAQTATPPALYVAAAVLVAEAVGMAVAAGFSASSTAAGQSYQLASGIALTVIALGMAVVFVLFALALVRARPWSRTPVVMTQLFAVIAGITLLDGHRPEWGVPALLLAAICLIALFTPAALRALNRPPRSP